MSHIKRGAIEGQGGGERKCTKLRSTTDYLIVHPRKEAEIRNRYEAETGQHGRKHRAVADGRSAHPGLHDK